MKHNIVSDGNSGSITVFVDGQLLVADSNHPNYRAIVEKAVSGDSEGMVDLFDATRSVAQRFERLSERVAVASGRVYFDGDEVHDTLTEQILRFMDEGVDDWQPLIKFWENLAQNPSEHSREHLYRWLNATGGFTITPEGLILGYKGLTADRTSVHAGPAIVDGVAVDGNVPNHEGSVVEIARSAVDTRSDVGCSVGLHVGTWEYASNFGNTTVHVLVNPRDVVSVPTDCYDRKMRVARYTVGTDAAQKDNRALYVDEADEDEDEYCPDCGDWVGKFDPECESCNSSCPECGDDTEGDGYCPNCDEDTR